MQVGRYCLTCDSETYTVSHLARLFGCSDRTIIDWIIVPRDPRTRKPAVDPETGDSILGCAVTRVGRETVIAAEDLKLWMRQHARPVIHSELADREAPAATVDRKRRTKAASPNT